MTLLYGKTDGGHGLPWLWLSQICATKGEERLFSPWSVFCQVECRASPTHPPRREETRFDDAMQNLTIAHTWNGAPLDPAEQVNLTLETVGAGLRVVVEAPYHQDPAPPGPAGPCPGLWNYEVVELFVVGEDSTGPRYTEFELSPHGHHLVLCLAGVRQIVEQGLPLSYTASIAASRWHGEMWLPHLLLPPSPHRLNAFAMHGLGPSRRYLAMAPVPGEAPDFHRLQYFLPWTLP